MTKEYSIALRLFLNRSNTTCITLDIDNSIKCYKCLNSKKSYYVQMLNK